MKPDKRNSLTAGADYFFVTLDLLVGIVILMAVISVSVMLYGGLQFIGR